MAERASLQLTQLLRGAYGSLQHKQPRLHLLCLQLQLLLFPRPTLRDSISPKPVVVGVRGRRRVRGHLAARRILSNSAVSLCYSSSSIGSAADTAPSRRLLMAFVSSAKARGAFPGW